MAALLRRSARPELAADPRFADNPARVATRPALDREIAAVFSTLGRATLVARLQTAAIAFGALNSVADLEHHPQLRRAEVATPGGPVDLVAPPARVTGETPALGSVPALNQHGAAIRDEFAE